MRILLFACLILTATHAFITPKVRQNAARHLTKTSSSKSITISSSSSSTALYEGPLDILSGIGETFSRELGSLLQTDDAKDNNNNDKKSEELPDVVIDPDYRWGIIFLACGIVLDTIPYIQFTIGPIITLLGLIFFIQTTRVRFCFDSTAFELRTVQDESEENMIVGGDNRWTYESFIHYDFFPKGWIDQPQGPISLYFKETDTPSEKWMEGPGMFANSPEALKKNGSKPGQIHFIPALCNAQQLRAELERRGCAKLEGN